MNRDEGTKNRARRLRRNQTDAERKLWQKLRHRQLIGARFRRQHPIGPFIADFCSTEHRLVIELDGRHHASQGGRDRERTKYLNHRGYRVLRFWDDEVLKETAVVVEVIAGTIRKGSRNGPSP